MSLKEEALVRFLKNLFIQRGWTAESISDPNLRADLLVCISRGTDPSALYFFADIKVAGNSSKEGSKASEVATSFLAVKKIVLWNVSPIAYITFVFCGNNNECLWIDSDSVIDQVNQAFSGNWKDRKLVRVKIPLTNNISPQGLTKLEQIMSKRNDRLKGGQQLDRQTKIGFSFPDTADAAEKRMELNRLIQSGGEPITLGAEYISEFKPPFWWARDLSELSSITVARSQASALILVDMDVISDDGTLRIPNMELRHSGPERLELRAAKSENKFPLQLTVYFFKPKGEDKIKANFRFVLKGPGTDVYESFEVGRQMLVLSAATRMRLFVRGTDRLLLDNPMPHIKMPLSTDALRERQVFFEKLVYIQDKIAQFGILTMEKKNIESDDIHNINKMYAICKGGRFTGSGTLSLTIDLTNFDYNSLRQSFREHESKGLPSELVISMKQNTSIKVLNITIPLGPVIFKCKIWKKHSEQLLGQIDKALIESRTEVKISLTDLQTEEEYPEWLSIP